MLDSTICACRNTDEPFCACSKNVAQHSCCLCVSGNDALTLNSFLAFVTAWKGKYNRVCYPKTVVLRDMIEALQIWPRQLVPSESR